MSSPPSGLPVPVLVAFRGVGQVIFQDHALTGLLFVLGVAAGSPVMAAGLLAGSAIGSAVAWGLKFDRGEVLAGIHGFNPALVGIATLFFFDPGALSLLLLVAGCVAAALLTYAARKFVPFPTYTAPFIVTTWVVAAVGPAVGAAPAGPGYDLRLPDLPVGPAFESVAHGVGQVMFQASVWTGLLFAAGIAVSNREHAWLVVLGAAVGALVAAYHVDAADRSLDPEQLVERGQFENIRFGLYGYNAALAPLALFLYRRSVVAPLLGAMLTVPLTEFVPRLGVPALTAPFVLATWAVLALGHFEARIHPAPEPTP